MQYVCGIWCYGWLGLLMAAQAQPIRVHDPVMIRQDGMYYLFSTGQGISVYSSSDRQNWKKEEPVFSQAPAWAVEAVPGFEGHIWAPDISYHEGTYYLYYSVSAFGKNTSCIGLATNVTLNPEEDDFQWIDHGKIVESVPGRDLWNAIDPHLSTDEQGTPWLSFGSFWNGIKLVRLQADRMGIAQSPQEWYTIASRPRDFKTDDRKAGDGAIEAPFIFKKNNYYYLFVSFDACCRGIESTYKIMVGRADHITGPYLDQEGMSMTQGGGTLVLQGDKRWPGVGHNAVYTFDGEDYLIFHGYDAKNEGKPALRIEKLGWNPEGWPTVSPQQAK